MGGKKDAVFLSVGGKKTVFLGQMIGTENTRFWGGPPKGSGQVSGDLPKISGKSMLVK